jgi:hypothetical protein
MRNLVGMEMICFGKSRHFELAYAAGGYADEKGEPVPDVLDMSCFVCTANYYTREGDAIPFCPNCGHFERKRFQSHQELVEVLRGQDFTWLKRNGLQAISIQTFDSGDWRLTFAKDAGALEASRKHRAVRKLG